MHELVQFGQNFDFKLWKEHGKNFLWALRLWVGRRYEPILGNVSKIYGKNNSGHKGLRLLLLKEWLKFITLFKNNI